jgi:hypothetical protein
VSYPLPVSVFEDAIVATHGVGSKLLDAAPVREEFEGEIVWNGVVLIFQLLDHPRATKCYAWEEDGEVTIVLHEGPVESPTTAVWASILAAE